MGANATNAMFFLVTTIFDLLLWAWILRIVLQWVRADFYNPLSQMIWQVTRFPTDKLRPYIPQYKNLNVTAALVAFVIALVDIYVVGSILNARLGLISAVVLAIMKLAVMTLNLYTFTLLVQAVLSWLGPGVNNPASNVLWSMNEPLLRPVRRLIPPMGGLDLSPLVVMILLQVIARLIPLGPFR